jgi:dTDP-4-dehydrorhamnose reductase
MRVVLTGASGQLGAYLFDPIRNAGHELIAWSHKAQSERGNIRFEPVELTDVAALERALDAADPDAVLHAAAISAADAVFRDPAHAEAVNVQATHQIADWCARRNRRLLFTSTDLVFDGNRAWNREEDTAEPVLAYGRTKRAAEPAVLAVPGGVVCRISLLYGFSRCGREAFFDRAVQAWQNGEPRAFFSDEFRTPLHLASAAEVLVSLLSNAATGIVHVGGPERISRFELMRRSAVALGFNEALVQPNHRADVQLLEPRPADVSLDTSRLRSILPDVVSTTIEESLRAASK